MSDLLEIKTPLDVSALSTSFPIIQPTHLDFPGLQYQVAKI